MISNSYGETTQPGLVKRKRVSADVPTESMTQQHFKDECDINSIMKRYAATGSFGNLVQKDPVYADFTQVSSFQESLDLVNHTRTQFNSFPSAIRDRFRNNPTEFLKFANDPANRDELVKYGLAKVVLPTPEPAPQKVIVVDPKAPSDVK